MVTAGPVGSITPHAVFTAADFAHDINLDLTFVVEQKQIVQTDHQFNTGHAVDRFGQREVDRAGLVNIFQRGIDGKGFSGKRPAVALRPNRDEFILFQIGISRTAGNFATSFFSFHRRLHILYFAE